MAWTAQTYSPEVQAAIRRRATEIYRVSGDMEGHDVENWYQAEAQVLRELASSSRRRAIVVNVDGVVYTGEYEPESAGGYTPGEWQAGDPVRMRVAGDQLYLRRPNGCELQIAIVKRIG